MQIRATPATLHRNTRNTALRVQWWGSLAEQPLPASSLTRNSRNSARTRKVAESPSWAQLRNTLVRRSVATAESCSYGDISRAGMGGGAPGFPGFLGPSPAGSFLVVGMSGPWGIRGAAKIEHRTDGPAALDCVAPRDLDNRIGGGASRQATTPAACRMQPLDRHVEVECRARRARLRAVRSASIMSGEYVLCAMSMRKTQSVSLTGESRNRPIASMSARSQKGSTSKAMHTPCGDGSILKSTPSSLRNVVPLPGRWRKYKNCARAPPPSAHVCEFLPGK